MLPPKPIRGPEVAHGSSANPVELGFWETIFDVVPYPAYVVDAGTYRLVSVNAAMRKKLPARVGDVCYRVIYQREAPCDFCKLTELSERDRPIGANTVFELYNDVDDRWYQLDETLISWFDGRLVKYSIAVDITRLMEMQSALAEAHAVLALKNISLENASATDSLTGLFNRRKLDEVLATERDRAARSGQPLSLIIADIDQFKTINDRFGHLVGDQVLRRLAEQLRAGTRPADLLGRWGGEEFLIVSPNTDEATAALLAESLRSRIEAMEIEGVGRGTASFGIAQWQAGESIPDLVNRADAALYRAKAGGRNRIER